MSTTGRVMCYFLYTTLLINLISDTNGQMLDRVGPPGSQGAPGPKGEMAQKGEKGEIGLFGITAHEGSDDGQMLDRVGPPGSQGAPGPKGEMGQKGEKGEIGLFGITAHEGSDDDDDKHREPPTPVKHGSEDDPATSCQDKNLDTSLTGPSVFIYPANPFQVNCGYSVTDKTCLIKSKTKEFKGPGPYKFQKSPFWLSNAGFDLLSFYGNFQVKNISQLKYLLKISYKVSLEIIVHCKNMEISEDPKKYLQIHLWDGQNIGPFSNSKSPVYYEIPDELNKCKNFADETKWETATIKLNAPSTFIKDFYIQDIKEGKEQGIYLELTSFCLYN